MAKKRNQKIKISSIVIYVFLIIWALTTIFPLVWSVVNSFKDKIFKLIFLTYWQFVLIR